MRTLSKSHKKLQCTKKEEKNKQFVYLECQKGVCSIRTWEVKKKKRKDKKNLNGEQNYKDGERRV